MSQSLRHALRTRVAGSVLGLPGFRNLWAGQAVSSIGDQLFVVAVSLRVVELGGDAGDVGLVLAGRILAVVVFALAGGVWADRLPRRRVMITADVVRMLCLVAVVAVPSGAGTLGLALLTFVLGTGEAFFRPAYGGLVPSVVPAERLVAANALRGATESTAAVLGPALGGVVVALAGTRTAFAVNAASFAVSLLCVLLVREPARTAAPRTSMLSEVRAGLSAVRATRWTTAVLAMTAVQTLLVVAPHMVLLPIVTSEEFDSESAYGTVLAVFSLSGLLGTLLVGRLRPRRPGLVAVCFNALFVAVPIVLLSPVSLGWVIAGYAVAGVAMMPFNVLWETALQRQFPAELMGRVTSVDWLVSLGLLPLGLMVAGPVADLVGRTPVLLVAAVVQVVSAALVLLVPGVRDFHQDAAPGPQEEPDGAPLAR
ncbi:MFS transporter [Streptomyces sp. S.PNR 29]|uniref:MFS transporter n=1 Tax=Streptomyces sp. S.PNR 29 TaxID=2973805 RepID=UPI0025AFA7F2|nr:MFS transporter [Streptomyces sp. S.PNR 29]MDN0194141.1 MFS transporter [Streptomyces sp. S.PNR 29]